MDFFEAQERAQKRTKRLVFLFAFAVLGTALAGYAASWFLLNKANAYQGFERDGYGQHVYRKALPPRPLFDPKLFLWVTGSTVAVVGLASLYKWSQLRAGGSAIAEMAGGRAVHSDRSPLVVGNAQ